MPCLCCRRCGLDIKIQAEFLRMENCPRCLARSATVTPLVISANVVRSQPGYASDNGVIVDVRCRSRQGSASSP
jgi:hypothetical protein